jgi:hypothetical protein
LITIQICDENCEVKGADKIPLLYEAFARGADFETALRQVIGIDQTTLEKQWREMLISEGGLE